MKVSSRAHVWYDWRIKEGPCNWRLSFWGWGEVQYADWCFPRTLKWENYWGLVFLLLLITHVTVALRESRNHPISSCHLRSCQFARLSTGLSLNWWYHGGYFAAYSGKNCMRYNLVAGKLSLGSCLLASSSLVTIFTGTSSDWTALNRNQERPGFQQIPFCSVVS